MTGNYNDNFSRTGDDVQIDDGLRAMGADPEQVRVRGTHGPMPVALSGYDPVAIHTRAHWSTAYTWWRGRR